VRALHERSAVDLLAAFGRGETTPSEVMEACLARLDACEPSYHAFRTRCDEAATVAAAAADRRWRRGNARALEGVPFAVKDIIETDGVLTTLGSGLFADWVPDRNATVVQRLLDAGAILVGKTATPEFAFGDAIEGHGPVNPWSADHWTGGSSSGSAVALAVHEVPIAVGTDTGGSIRVPASYCGVAGLKPTFGVVPRDGVVPVSWTLDHTGPMARSIDDLALVLGAMAGPSARDPSSSRRPPGDARNVDDVRGLRVGVPTDWFFDSATPEVVNAVHGAIDRLVGLGATVRPVALPHAHLGGVIAWTITVCEFASLHEADLDRLDDLTPSAADRVVAGAAMSAADYLRALRARALVQRDFEAAFAAVDVIVTPATPTPAPRVTPPIDPLFELGDRAWLDHIARNLLAFNVTGMPALVVPIGLERGLPVGLQVAGPPFAEGTILSVGHALDGSAGTLTAGLMD